MLKRSNAGRPREIKPLFAQLQEAALTTGDILAPLAPLGLLSGNKRGTRGAIAGCALSRDSSDPCAARPHVFGPERSGARISWGRKVAIWGPRFFDGTARAASAMT